MAQVPSSRVGVVQRDWQWEMATRKRSLQWEGFGDLAGPALLIAAWVQASGLGVGKSGACSSPALKTSWLVYQLCLACLRGQARA